ncbi:MAG: metallophosphoesterase [Candidatus Bathyarchaeota archaeon]|jgi:putative SbcD/Mre11-related phosphoesterase|nr:metallophosphoesterase [Candidatus Bathyarchaeota archaeon]
MISLIPNSPALLVKSQKERIMAIADLHIGWEIALSQKGIHIPTQTPKLLQKLISLLAEHKPEKLLIVGDIKHTVETAATGEWRDVPDFFNSLQKHVKEILVIRGNHDGNLEPLLPQDIKILPAIGAVFCNVGFFHGHCWPSPTLLRCETLVMAHVHPVIVFRDHAGFTMTKQVWVRAACRGDELAKTLMRKGNAQGNKKAGKPIKRHYGTKPKASYIFIMPSFNDFLGGRPLNLKNYGLKGYSGTSSGPVLRSKTVDMENSEAYLLDGTFLGNVSQLRVIA